MANTRAIWQQAAHTTYQPSCPCCSTSHTKKSLTKTVGTLLEKQSGEWTISRKMARQKSVRK